jgi:hypothetical protein
VIPPLCWYNDIIFTTFYRDIGRGNWEHEKRRNSSIYLQNFLRLVEYLTDFPIIVYVELKHQQYLQEYLINHTNIYFISLNQVNSFYEQYSPIEKILQNSELFQGKLKKLQELKVENIYSEYTSITNS